MNRRDFRAPPDDERCEWNVILRGDKSGARCMRGAKVANLCVQHYRMDTKMRAAMPCCGGNDEAPPDHCMDCETRKQAP